jgi:hypothetical protein
MTIIKFISYGNFVYTLACPESVNDNLLFGVIVSSYLSHFRAKFERVCFSRILARFDLVK